MGSTLFSAKKEAGKLPAGGGTIIERLMDALAVRLPEVPVTETVDAPAAAEPLTVKVRVLVEVGLAGLNAAVTPAGNPDAERLTDPEKPLAASMVIVLDPLEPCCRVTLPGVEERPKVAGSGLGDTVDPPPQDAASGRLVDVVDLGRFDVDEILAFAHGGAFGLPPVHDLALLHGKAPLRHADG